MTKVVNNTENDISLNNGRVVPGSGELAIDKVNFPAFSSDDSLWTHLSSGDLKINDGQKDLSLSESIDHLKGFQQKFQATSDNRLLAAPNRIPAGYTVYPTGESSDVANGNWQGGTLLKWTTDGTKDFQLLDHWYAIGGRGVYVNCDDSVRVSAWLCAPATPAVSNVGAGAYSKVPIGGGVNLFAPGGGDWDIDLTEKLNGNVKFTKAVPVSSPTKTGFFDYDYNTDSLTVNAQQKGGYNLFDAQAVLFCFANRISGMKDGERYLDVDSVVGKVLLPHWFVRFKVEGVTAVSGVCSVDMITAVKSNVDAADQFGTPWT